MLANILDPVVWSVRHAPDNKAALALAGATHFDLILTSEKTSGKEDVDLLRRVRSIRPHTRLIILAEEGTPADVIASMREGAFSYFSRPFSMSSLADMVLTAAEGPCWDDGIEVVSATPDWIRLLARCDLKTADRLMQFMHEIADLPEPESDAVAMAFREILMNAIEHGGHHVVSRAIRMRRAQRDRNARWKLQHHRAEHITGLLRLPQRHAKHDDRQEVGRRSERCDQHAPFEGRLPRRH